jgi:hypothetical protein
MIIQEKKIKSDQRNDKSENHIWNKGFYLMTIIVKQLPSKKNMTYLIFNFILVSLILIVFIEIVFWVINPV